MNSAHVLIIDDEPQIRDTMKIALDAVGYRTETAADGPEGLQKFGAGEQWDLVLLDQRMPGMEGIEVLRHIRERDPEARVMMVTAYGTIELAVDAMKAGAVDFLRKPFTPDMLRGAVQAALAHPRQPAPAEDRALMRLLPRAPAAAPPIQFRTLNGFHFRELPLPEGEEESEALRIRRAFEIRAPGGELRRCIVELATPLRERIRAETGHDYAAADPLWDTVCRSALSDHLWQKAELPPEVMVVYDLTLEQMRVVRNLAGLGPSAWR
jgi:CheY-like chemotaxis protein